MAKNKKKKSPIGVIVLIVIIALIAGGITYYFMTSKKDPIPDDAIGNTSGNLNNRGLFCEYDGYVYFSNAYDQRKLYRMKPDGSELKRIADVPVEFINVYDDTIYFYQTPGADNQIFGLGGLYGICWTDINGRAGMNVYDKSICNSLTMCGPKLYYQHYESSEGITLYEVDLNSGDKKKISDKEVFCSTPVNGKLMTYNPELGYSLSLFNTDTDQYELFDQNTRAYNIIVDGNYIYFMDIDDSYKIYRMGINDYRKTKVVDEKVDLFNVYGDYIYYQKSGPDSPGLMRSRIDGSSAELIASGNFKNINCTSEYTYFYPFDDSSTIYRVANRPGAQPETFMP